MGDRNFVRTDPSSNGFVKPSCGGWRLADRFAGHEGCLRLLRDGTDIDNFAVEVPPVNGTLLVFPNGETTWHGHKQFVGPRYAIQLNYMTADGLARSEMRRHRLSALVKRWTRAA